MQAPVIVYGMSGAGYSPIVDMLTQLSELNRRVYHVHSLRDDGIGRAIIDNADWEQQREIVDAIDVRRLLAKAPLSEELPAAKKWKWITPIREPIARNLDDFFRHHERYIPDMVSRWESGGVTVNEIRDAFIQHCDHMQPLRWFDDEYKALFKLDAYEVPFEQSEGYIAIQTTVFDILLVRADDIQQPLIALFEEFLETKGLTLPAASDRDNLPYSKVYQAFLEQAHLPKQYVDAMFNTPYMKTFYSENQIDQFRKTYIGQA